MKIHLKEGLSESNYLEHHSILPDCEPSHNSKAKFHDSDGYFLVQTSDEESFTLCIPENDSGMELLDRIEIEFTSTSHMTNHIHSILAFCVSIMAVIFILVSCLVV